MGLLNIRDGAPIAAAREGAAPIGASATGAVRARPAPEEARQREVAGMVAIGGAAPGGAGDHSHPRDENGLPK